MKGGWKRGRKGRKGERRKGGREERGKEKGEGGTWKE